MLGFFMGYAVDGLTGMDIVGQTGNWVCKTAILVTLLGVILLRRTEDVKKLRKLADEATFYDKQWKAAWLQDQIHHLRENCRDACKIVFDLVNVKRNLSIFWCCGWW
ncbi:hypothetical protein LINPERHAP1_LOCUS32057, partial [Linum perenne]